MRKRDSCLQMERPLVRGGEWEKPQRTGICGSRWSAVDGLQGPGGASGPSPCPAERVTGGVRRACRVETERWPGQFRLGQSCVFAGPCDAGTETEWPSRFPWQSEVLTAVRPQFEVPASAAAHEFAQLTIEVSEEVNTAAAATIPIVRRARAKVGSSNLVLW